MFKQGTGLYIGPSHDNGGIPVEVLPSHSPVEVEGLEYLLCAAVFNSNEVLEYVDKTNYEIIDDIYQRSQCNVKDNQAWNGDFVMCKRGVLDSTKRSVKGTVKEILSIIQGEHGCKVVEGVNIPAAATMQTGGTMPAVTARPSIRIGTEKYYTNKQITDIELAGLIATALGEKLVTTAPRLGSGSFGNAYLLEGDKVLKLTSASDEATTANKLLGLDLQYNVKYYKVALVDGNIIDFRASMRPLYAIVKDYAFMDKDLAEGWKKLGSVLDPNPVDKRVYNEQFLIFEVNAGMPTGKLYAWKQYLKKYDLEHFLEFFTGLYNELHQAGITYNDLSEKNVGVNADGRMVAFDIGLTSGGSPVTNRIDISDPDLMKLGGKINKDFDLGDDHRPFIKVVKGGSSCANCKFLVKLGDKFRCKNLNFIKWNKTSELPPNVDEICSDWYEPNPTMMKMGGKILLAPNGKPSLLNNAQWHIVRSPAFKKWFGNWEKAYKTRDYTGVSKVIDENGEPLVVYHVTDKDFFVFDKKKSKEGFFFSPNKERLEAYEKSKTLSFFLNIKNPSHELFETDLKYLIPKGYDGIMDYGHGRKVNRDLYEIISFYPNQIKLADGTNTMFDPESADIRMKDGGGLENSEKKIFIYNDTNSVYDRQAQRLIMDYLGWLNKKVNQKRFFKFLSKFGQVFNNYDTVIYNPRSRSEEGFSYFDSAAAAYRWALINDDENPSFIHIKSKDGQTHYKAFPEAPLFGDYLGDKYDEKGKLKQEVMDSAIADIEKGLAFTYSSESGSPGYTLGGFVSGQNTQDVEIIIDEQGRKRFKINDVNAHINKQLVNDSLEIIEKSKQDIPYVLSDILYHWDGFKHYPDLKNLSVSFTYNENVGYMAAYFQGDDKIFINAFKLYADYEKYLQHIRRIHSSKNANSRADSRAAGIPEKEREEYVYELCRRKLFHELAHAIQSREGIELPSTQQKDVLLYAKKKYNKEYLTDQSFKTWLQMKHGTKSWESALYQEYKTIPSEKEAFEVEQEFLSEPSENSGELADGGKLSIHERPDMENPVYKITIDGIDKYVQRQEGMNPGDTAWYEVKKDRYWNTVGTQPVNFHNNIGYNKEEAVDYLLKKYGSDETIAKHTAQKKLSRLLTGLKNQA